MSETLLHAYVPLVVWTSLGLILVRFVPESFPRLLGRGLYWVGVPIQIFTLSRQTGFSSSVGLVPAIALLGLIMGLGFASVALWQLERSPHLLPIPSANPPTLDPNAPMPGSPDSGEDAENPWQDASRRGGFLLSSMLGNTGFVGLAVAPNFVAEPYRGWIVLYSVVHNVVGTYGMGVLLASFYGRSDAQNPWFTTLRDVFTVPSLWAFAIGFLSRSVPFPDPVEQGLRLSLWVVIPAALLLMGIRLRQIQGWQGLKLGILPSLSKMVLIPLGVGLMALSLQLPADPRLALVLMAGMPTAFAGLILAEEYELNREIIASSIVLSTLMLFLTIPVWLLVFG